MRFCRVVVVPLSSRDLVVSSSGYYQLHPIVLLYIIAGQSYCSDDIKNGAVTVKYGYLLE